MPGRRPLATRSEIVSVFQTALRGWCIGTPVHAPTSVMTAATQRAIRLSTATSNRLSVFVSLPTSYSSRIGDLTMTVRATVVFLFAIAGCGPSTTAGSASGVGTGRAPEPSGTTSTGSISVSDSGRGADEAGTPDSDESGRDTGLPGPSSTGSTSTGEQRVIPCAERPQELCDGVLPGPDDFAPDRCEWIPEVSNLPSDGCESKARSGACLEFPGASGTGCSSVPRCPGALTEYVFYRERDDGTVDILPANYCGGEPKGFEYCAWGEPGTSRPPGKLLEGPAACDCAC